MASQSCWQLLLNSEADCGLLCFRPPESSLSYENAQERQQCSETLEAEQWPWVSCKVLLSLSISPRSSCKEERKMSGLKQSLSPPAGLAPLPLVAQLLPVRPVNVLQLGREQTNLPRCRGACKGANPARKRNRPGLGLLQVLACFRRAICFLLLATAKARLERSDGTAELLDFILPGPTQSPPHLKLSG